MRLRSTSTIRSCFSIQFRKCVWLGSDQRLAICWRQRGQLFWPFLIHCSMHSVWKMCFSSQCSVVTKSLRLKSLQQIGHQRHSPLMDSFRSYFFFLKAADLCLNFDLSRDEIISGTGRGIVSKPPNIPSINKFPFSSSSSFYACSQNSYSDISCAAAYPFSFLSVSRSLRRIILILL